MWEYDTVKARIFGHLAPVIGPMKCPCISIAVNTNKFSHNVTHAA